MKMKRSAFFLCVLSTILFPKIYSTIKGSETELSVEPFYTFLSTETDNKMLGFGWFKNGFALEDSSTTCTFDSVFPVSGNIYLNGGGLRLSADLLLRNMTTWHTSGNIYGNNYFVDFSSSVTGLAGTTYDQVFDNAKVNINSDLIISGSVKFQGDCLFNGNGKRILLDSDGYIIIDSGANVTFKDVYIDGIIENKICCIDDSSKIILDDVLWIQDGNYSFTQGSFKIFNKVDFIGSYTFFYQSSQTSTIDTHSFWNIYQGLKISVGRKNGADDIEPLYFEDETSVLNLENCCLSITSSGMRMTHGLMIVDRGVEIDINSTDSTHGFILGDGTEAGDMEFRFHPGARVNFSKGDLVYENTDPTSLRSRSGEAFFVRGADSRFYINDDIELKGIALDTHPSSQMTVADGKDLSYDDCRIIYPGVEFELGGSRYNNYTNLMNGDGEIFLRRGTLTPYTYVQNSGNTLHGNGDISGKIILEDSDTELTIDVNGAIANDVDLNGGKFILAHDVLFTQDAIFNGGGTIDIDEYTLSFGVNDLNLTNTLNWFSNNGLICFNSQIDLSGTWTIDGTCVIDGAGYTLNLQPGGKIVLGQGASLEIKRLKIKGISGNNICCFDDSCTLTLEDVDWCQDGDFSFTTGKISFENKVSFDGAYTFSYQSSQTSTIQKNSLLLVAGDMRLEIGRYEAEGGLEPLNFIDPTSVLKLNNCTFVVTDSGMQLTRGTFRISHDVMLEINSTSSNNGLIFGNGQVDDDLVVDFYSGAALHCVKGHLVVEETDSDFFSLNHGNARVVRQADSVFYVNQDMTISNLIIENQTGSSMIVKDGKNITYENCDMLTSYADFMLTGVRGSDYSNFLAGDDELFMKKGTLPAHTYIWNSGNLILGNGSISGAIVLQDSDAQVQFNLNGNILTDISLNNGTIILGDDLHIVQDKMLVGPGTVNLADSSLYLGSRDKTWTSSIYWTGDVGRIHISSKISLLGTWTFDGECLLHGHGNTLQLESIGQIVVTEGSLLRIKDLRIEGINGNNLRCIDGASKIHFCDATWIQDSDFSFTVGSLEFENKVSFGGAYTFSYETDQTSTVLKNSKWTITDDMKLSIGRYEAVDYIEPLYFEDETATLKLNRCTLFVTDSGIQLTRGTFSVNQDVMLEINSTTSSNGLIFGDGIVDNDLNVSIYPGAALHCVKGHLVVEEVEPNFFSLNHGNARVIRQADSVFYVNQDMIISNLIIDTDANSSMIVQDGKNISYSNCLIETDYADFNLTGMRGSDYVNFLIGNGNIFLHKGTLPTDTYVWGSGNKIRGNGNISGEIILQDASASCSFDLNGSILSDIALNGGTISLNDDLSLAHDKVLTGSGTVDLNSQSLVLGSMDKTWAGTTYWDGDEGHLHLGANVSLSGKWTFSGLCVVHGGWKILELGQSAEIIVERGSNLILRQVKLKDLKDYNIRCLGPNSSIMYDDCKARMNGNYTFTQGSFIVQELLELHGNYTTDTFIYQSAQQSIIYPCTSLRMVEGTTLSYAPLVPLRDRIAFYNVKAKLELDYATLHSTSTGFQMLRGTLEIEGDSYISSDASVPVEGITFGDGISAGNDFNVEILPNANIEITSGYVVDKNVE